MRVFSTVTAALLISLLSAGSTAYAQAYAPIVHFTVTLPDGTAKDLQAPESGLATVTVSGREYGIRPTMMDDQGGRIIMTVFDMGTSSQAVREVGEVEVKAGGAVAATRSQPILKIKATSVQKSETAPTTGSKSSR